MPAEWAPHAATWIAWPHNREDWPGRFTPIPWIYADIVRLLATAERVRIIVRDDADARRVRRVLARNDVRLDNVDLLPLPTDRVWTRDSGPSIVRRADGARAVVHWKFNAWAKYDNYALDAKVPELVARTLGVDTFAPVALDATGRRHRIVLEGGSIEVDGAGTVMTTEECLLSDVQARNPGLSRAAIEEVLCAYLGARQVLWLGRGIAGDDTHGHIDDTARFAGTGRVVTCVEPNRDDSNHEPLAENLRRLRVARDADGRPFEIVELPMPAPVIFDGQRLPASYANFYVANAGVLVPVFNDPNDRLALDVLAACFTDRPVIPVYCRDLVWGLGTLHCMTQQEPS
jgi:agmatine deiminase